MSCTLNAFLITAKFFKCPSHTVFWRNIVCYWLLTWCRLPISGKLTEFYISKCSKQMIFKSRDKDIHWESGNLLKETHTHKKNTQSRTFCIALVQICPMLYTYSQRLAPKHWATWPSQRSLSLFGFSFIQIFLNIASITHDVVSDIAGQTQLGCCISN